MIMRNTTLAATLMAGCALTALRADAQTQTPEIGNVAAVNRDMSGTPPGVDRRLLSLGNEVVQDERIETTDVGSGQLLFADQTSLTVSPNTDIKLDKYIYDPNADSGDVALTMTKGALRFIGGRITKKRRAVVRTPTATIGIRGGMVLIQIDANGQLKVTHLAGESTVVVSYGDSDADGLDDGPTQEDLEAFVDGGPPSADNQVVLSRPSSTADTEPSDQLGAPNKVQYTGIATSNELQDVYGAFEGTRDGGTQNVPTNDEVDRQTIPIAQINSNVPDGQKTPPVSTLGESFVAPRPPDETFDPQPLAQTPPADTATEEFVEDVIEQDPDVVDPQPATLGGNFFVPGQSIEPFIDVRLGSLIGETASGEIVTVEVPESPAELLATNPLTDGQLFAQTRFPNSGFFELAQGDASSTSLGDLTGVGFADLDNDFFLVPVEGDGGQPALILFGEPTVDQFTAFTGDPAAPAGANLVDNYVVEAISGEVDALEPNPFSIISNAGADGARMLFGTLDIDGSDEDLSVLAGALAQGVEGQPVISTAALSTNAFSFGTFRATGFAVTNIGTVEDAAGNTLFGPDGDYIVISSAFREGGTGDFVVNDPGSEIEITATGTEVFEVDPDAALLTLDPTQREIVVDPFAFANDTTGLAPGETPGTLQGFATGIAVCGDGRACGSQITSAAPAGVYALEPISDGESLLPSATIAFGGGLAEANTFLSAFILTDGEQSGLVGGPDGADFFALINDPNASAAIDDDRFGSATEVSPASIVAGNEGAGASVIVASSGLVGDGGLVPAAAIDAVPNFYRWGWWSAAISGTDAATGGDVTDVVHLGTFVVGNLPNPVDFAAFTGSATFNGIAAGTHADLTTGATTAIAGTSILDYNFGQQAGALTLSLPDIGFAETFDVASTGNIAQATYGGSIDQTGLSAVADGTFFSGGGDLIAATGGQFDIQNALDNSRTVGVFGADASVVNP